MSRRAESIRRQFVVVPIAGAVCVLLVLTMPAANASAGTYPMSQCSAAVPAVSPGWSTFGNNTNANTALSNTCSAGGSIGDYVFTNEQAGVVTENGSSGGRVSVPG